LGTKGTQARPSAVLKGIVLVLELVVVLGVYTLVSDL